jgi:hypothetical protein
MWKKIIPHSKEGLCFMWIPKSQEENMYEILTFTFSLHFQTTGALSPSEEEPLELVELPISEKYTLLSSMVSDQVNQLVKLDVDF